MLNVRAKIKLYKGDGYRQTPFVNGYRPLFNFISESKKSGKINLIDTSQFLPGDEGIVTISFIDEQYLGNDFGTGKTFTFGEGSHTLGEGKVLEVVH
jgi:translation elongation factor EF-Tu-like GTPase